MTYLNEGLHLDGPYLIYDYDESNGSAALKNSIKTI